MKKSFLAISLIMFLSSCASKVIPSCPKVLIERDTAQAIYFSKDSGQDITDRILEVELLGYDGECQVNTKKNEVELNIKPFFEAELGAAAKERNINIDYFIAIPEFYPSDEGKKVLGLNLEFPENIDLIRFRDNVVKVKIPLKEGQIAEDLDVFLGIQLTKEQLEYNRKIRK